MTAIFAPVEHLKRIAMVIPLSSFKRSIWDKKSKAKTANCGRAQYRIVGTEVLLQTPADDAVLLPEPAANDGLIIC